MNVNNQLIFLAQFHALHIHEVLEAEMLEYKQIVKNDVLLLILTCKHDDW
jgi:hypothetical protein